MTSHPDVEALAFFAEELLEPGEESTVASHIETCATCATTLEQLTGVTEALAAVPAPPIPRDVVDLLDHRVAEAARERAEGGPVLAPASSDDAGGADAPSATTPAAGVTPITRRRRRLSGVHLPRLMMAAAAVAVLAGGGAALFNGLTPQDGDEAGVAAPLQQDEEAAPDTAQAYSPQVVSSGTVYTGSDLSEQASRTLDLSPVGAARDDDAAEPLSVRETAPPGVVECAGRLGDELDTRFTLVDDAHFGDGSTRAWALFALDGDEYDVYLVDPLCARGGDTEGSVLARESVPRP